MKSLRETTEFFLIRALDDNNVDKTIQSFLQGAAGFQKSDINVIDECRAREETLNKILDNRDKDKDCFIFVDDIRFEGNWWHSLENATNDGDIIGFSMIDAKTGLLQDFGYDFISLDGQVIYRGLYKHSEPNSLSLPNIRECDAICGCCIWIRKEVFDVVSQFPEEGCNRWGEMLFSYLAKKRGFRTVVLSDHLKHFGTSTKNTDNPVLSSQSWLVERELWSKVVEKFLIDVVPRAQINRMFDSNLEKIILSAKNIMLYGCGTVAEILGERLLANKKFVVVSALPEEANLKFLGKLVQPLASVNLEEWDLILITPIGYRHIIEPIFKQNRKHRLIFLSETYRSNDIVYTIDQ